MAELFQLSVAGLGLGAAYALIALGFVVIFKSSGIFNFAHGELLSVGAFSMSSLASAGVPWPLALVLAMVITGAVASAVERAVIRPMIGRPLFITVIVTLFIASLLRAGVLIVWGPEMRAMPTPWPTTGSFHIGGVVLPYGSLATIAVAAVLAAGFLAVLKYTRLGIAMRATFADPEVALALGIPVGRMFSATWFAAGMLAAVAGVLLSLFPRGLDSNLDLVALMAFPAVIVGGLESVLGAVVASLLLGLSEVWAQAYLEPMLGNFGPGIHKVAPYAVMIVVLILRPRGLFGRPEVERL